MRPAISKKSGELSKGAFGSVTCYSNQTVFTFFKTTIEKRKKLKEEMNAILKSFKEHKINEGMLKIKSINNNNSLVTIITEPVIDSLANLHNTKFKGFEIFKMFDKFNVFLKYCFNKKINLSNLKFSDIYLTKNLDIKILTLNYDTEIIHNLKKEKKSNVTQNNNNNTNNMLYTIGTIMYYLYYNEYPKKNETKFPEQKHFKELLQYCLNLSTQFDYDEYVKHTFFHPDIIFPNNTKENIKLFKKYVEYIPYREGIMSTECEELYYVSKEKEYKKYYTIYNSFDKSKIIEEIKSENNPRLLKLKSEKNKNIYVIVFSDNSYILKKNTSNNFSVIQDNLHFKNFIELSSGDLAFIHGDKIEIYSKNSEDKFITKSVLSDINSLKLFYEENEELIPIVLSYFGSSVYYEKVEMIKGYQADCFNIKENIQFRNTNIIYHEFFEEEMLKIKDIWIKSITKKKDGTYLMGGHKNHIFQIYFDKYGFPEVLSEVDTGYGVKQDDCKYDCIYSYSGASYYSVGLIEECENGDIITISCLDSINKFWRYKK